MPPLIRDAESRDLPAIARLAALLVRQHYDFDAQRFLLVPNVESGYAEFFAGELASPSTLILAAERDGQMVGYAYARLEPRDWNSLLDSCGALHDIFVVEEARRGGVARALVQAVRERLRAKGAPRLVLHTASKNVSARHFFSALGFRETMIEFTAEL